MKYHLTASIASLFAALAPVGKRLHKGRPIQRPARLLPRVPDTKAEIDARAAVAHSRAWNIGRRQHEKACVNVSKWRRALQYEANEQARQAAHREQLTNDRTPL